MGRLHRSGVLLLGIASACYVGASNSADSDTGESDTDSAGGGADTDDDDPEELPGELCGDASPEVAALRRLSVVQYENTLRDLLADVPDVYGSVQSLAAALPVDGEGTTFSTMDNRLAGRHIDTWFAVAVAVGDEMLADDAVLAAIAGDCATAADLEDQCLEAFVTNFGLKVHRHPLSDEDVERYLGLVSGDRTGPENYRDIAVAMLMSPRFVYHFEVDGAPAAGLADVLVLDGYEIASRLSYHFWQSMPDAELFAAAADGRLNDEAGYQEQLERMLRSDRARETTEGFYREWFVARQFGGLADTPAFRTFSEDVAAFGGDPLAAGDELRAAMLAELDALTSYYTFDQDGSVADLLTTNLSFTDSPMLAELYGVQPWDGVGVPPEFPPGQRAGVQTRAATLVTGDHTTNPIHRGIDLQHRLLCADIPVPTADQLPPGAFDPPPLDPTMTTRERIDTKTSDQLCVTCHAFINPFGHTLEAYDGLARFREIERVIDDEGNLLAELPVDASATLVGLAGDTTVSGPVEFAEVAAGDQAYRHCFAKHYFEFTYRREPTGSDSDTCMMEGVETRAEEGSIRSALAEIASQTEFRIRGVE